MKKYRVNVNGTQYDITLEVLEGEAAAAAPKAAPAAAPAAPAAVASVLVNASSMIYLTVCYALGPASTTS